MGNRYEVEVLTDKCKGCEICVVTCPRGNLAIAKGTLNKKGFHPVVWDFNGTKGTCTGCGICYMVCPDYAIATVKERVELKRTGGESASSASS